MSNDYFKFKHFTIYHDRCGMKVGTDGVLLGSWAPLGLKILDVGAGTGLISLMMAQRSPSSVVDAVEIDEDAAIQAKENVNASDFSKRINIFHASLQDFCNTCMLQNKCYDCIVSNPPFYTEDTACPESKRHTARHTDSMTYAELFRCASKIITENGVFSIIVPYEAKEKIMLEACITGFYVNEICCIRTTPRKQPKRMLMTFSYIRYENAKSSECCMMNADGSKSEWYKKLTSDFYL